MTPRDIQNCVDAMAEYREAHEAYRQSYDAIHRYKRADDELRRLLWEHGPGLIELAAIISQGGAS